MNNGPNYEQLVVVFASIIYEALPFVVLGVLLAGLLDEFLPQQLVARFIPRRKLYIVLSIAIGGLMGLVFPMCECGIIPVMRRLMRKGIPLSVCVCYVLAGPIINVVVIFSTMAAFSGQKVVRLTDQYEVSQSIFFAVMRVGLGYIVAVITCIVVEWQHRKYGNALLAPIVIRENKTASDGDLDDEGNPRKHSWGESLANISQTTINDFIDIMAFLVIGAALASAGRLLIPYIGVEAIITEHKILGPILAILLMMCFAVAFSICSEADAFVAANFQPIDLWPLSSKLAFLVLGPMLDCKLFMMYMRVFRPRLIFTIFGCVALQVFVYSILVHYAYEWWLNPQ